MPTDSVARRVNVVVRRWLRMRSSRVGKCYSVCPLVSLDLIVMRCCAPDGVRGMKFKYSRCSRLLFCRGGSGFSLFRREMKAKVFVSSDRGRWGLERRRKELGEGDSGEDEGGAQEGAAAKMFMQNEE